MLWWDLRRTLHKWTPANLRIELKQCCKNEWAKIPSQWVREWKSYRKQILHIVAAKSCSMSYWNGVCVVFEQTGTVYNYIYIEICSMEFIVMRKKTQESRIVNIFWCFHNRKKDSRDFLYKYLRECLLDGSGLSLQLDKYLGK